MFNELVPVLQNMRSQGVDYKILFLEASNEKIVTRYKETRRSHPMAKFIRIDSGEDQLVGINFKAILVYDNKKVK